MKKQKQNENIYRTKEYEKIFLSFFQKLPRAYIFINCTNLWKFILIVFNIYLNFIKLSNTSAIFWKASIKFEQVFCKIYTNFIHNLPKFFPNIPLIFFNILTNITKNSYFLKIFVVFSRQFPNPLLTFYQVFCKFLKFSFKDLLRFSIVRFSLILMEKVWTFLDHILRSDCIFHSRTKTHCLRTKLCWHMRFHIAKKLLFSQKGLFSNSIFKISKFSKFLG